MLLPSLALAKPPAGIEIGVAPGYGGFVQQGRVNPVAVTLRNTTASTNISGELVLGYDGMEYTTPLELPTPSQKRFYLYFPCADYPPNLTLRVRSKQYTDEFQLYDPVAFKSMRAEDFSVLVLSNTQGALNMLNQQSLAHLYRNPYRSETSQLSSGRVYVSYMKPEDVDPSAKFFSRADVIVLADIDYQQVTKELAEALKEAVSSGASLVFSLGFNGAGVAASPLADLCPLQYQSTAQVGDLGQFGTRYKIATKGAPAVLAAGKIAPGAAVLDWAGSLPAVVQQQRGSGTVTALAFDITEAPFKRNSHLSNVFLENVLRVDDTTSVSSSFMHPYPLKLILGKLAEAKPMRPGFVLLYLLAYILLVGPLNFLILDRFKRRTLVWTTIPVLIVAFSALGMQTGYIRRGANNIAAYVQELHVYPGASYAPYQTVMTLFTARRRDYTLEVEDPGAYLFPSIPDPTQGYMGNATGGLALTSRGRLVTQGKPLLHASQGQWDSRFYTYQGELPLQGGVSSNLTAWPDKNGLYALSGSFTLNLPYDLKYAQLIGPGGFTKQFGSLSGHGVYDVTKLEQAGAGMPQGNYLLQQWPGLISSVRDSEGFNLFYRSEVLLVGFTDQLEAGSKLSAHGKSYKVGMVIVHLPYTPQLDSTEAAQVRVLLTGGSAFDLKDQGYGFGGYQYNGQSSQNTSANPSNQRQYVLQKDSTLDLTCTVSGKLRANAPMLLHLQGYGKNNEPLQDMRGYIHVDYLAGDRWVPAQMADPKQVLIPLNETGDAGRRLQVRLTAITDCTLDLPDADI